MALGRFITFEGGEGAGKSTQVRLLAEKLRSIGREVVVTREPGGTPFAEQVRGLILAPDVAEHTPLSEALLFYAARADHIDKVIRPALERGGDVVCDRFSDSTRIYQTVAGTLPLEQFQMLEDVVVAATRPVLTIILDLPAVEGLSRTVARRQQKSGGADAAARADRFEARDLNFHETLRQGFLDLARAEPQRCVVINAAQAVEVVASDIWQEIVARWLAEVR